MSLTTGGNADSGEMSFWEHLEALRSTLVACLVAFAVAACFSLVFSKEIFELLRYPLEHSEAVSRETLQALVVLRFMDTFSILFYIALLGGIVLAGPFIVYRIGHFVAPALSARERSRLIPFCVASSALFLAGATAAFFWLAPVSVSLPYCLADYLGLQMRWLAEDYYLFVVALTLFSGLMFEFPLVVVFLQYSGIADKKTLVRQWRWVLSGILLAVLVISPIGDPVVLLAFSGLLFAMYWVSVFIGSQVAKRKSGDI